MGDQLGTMRSLVGRVRQRVGLTERVAALEVEIQECRELNLRLAELIDVVGELLLPVAERDEDAVKEVLRRYAAAVGGPAR
jgi:hypothetical protein